MAKIYIIFNIPNILYMLLGIKLKIVVGQTLRERKIPSPTEQGEGRNKKQQASIKATSMM